MRPRQWRSILWRDTQAQTHFRSTQSQSVFAAPDILVRLKRMYLQRATDVGLGQFWTPAGGLIPADGLTPFAQFHGDKTIRGGKIFADFTNQSPNDAIKVQVWLIWAPAGTVFPSTIMTPFLNPLPVTREFDVTHIPDLKRFGRVVMARETILLALQRPWHVEYRLKPQKLDTLVYEQGGGQFYWLYALASYSETDTIGNAVQVIFSYSLSFASDVIATTL